MILPRSTATTCLVGYVGTSMLASIVGKIVATRFFFDYPIVTLMLQMSVPLFVIEALRIVGLAKISAYSFEKGRQCIVPSLLLCISQWLTVASFEGIGLPEFDSVKRLTPLFISVFAGIFTRLGKPTKNQAIAVAALSIITLITLNFELSFDRFSLFYGILASILQAIAYLQFENLSQTFPALELLYMYSFNSLIVFLIADIVQDEIRDAFMYMMTSAHPLFSGVFIIYLILAVPLQYATFACIEHNGALNTQVVSNIRAVVQIFIGYTFNLYLFFDTSPGLLNYMGLLATFPALYYYFMHTRKNEGSNIPWTTKA